METTNMTALTERVRHWLGRPPVPDQTVVASHVAYALQMAYGYTRGRGFGAELPAWGSSADDVVAKPDLLAVVVSSAGRSFSNPTLVRRIEAGSWSELPGSMEGWSAAELAVLRRYRKMAA